MTEKFSKDKLALFDSLIKSLSLALTNSALYPPDHPAFTTAIESLKDTLDKWLTSGESLELGISSDNLMLNGEFIKEPGELYSDVADYLHKKGLIAVSFAAGISLAELSSFFNFLKNDPAAIAEKGGIAKNIGAMTHLTVKEVDYSALLTSARVASALDEKDIWKSLSGIGKELKKGQLPKSKAEFMTDFLKDPKKSAKVLNKIYKEALAKIDKQSTAGEIRDVFSEMNKYFEKHSGGGAGGAKKEMADIMSNLDPDLVVNLFKDKAAEDDAPDLADELFKGLSDDMMADFMASLMKNGNNVNEKMIKLFGRLVSGQDKAGSVLPMMADKLFSEKLLSRDTLSALQGSIKDLFESHPDDDVINQIYNLTVGSLLDKGKDAGGGLGRYALLINEYKESLKADSLKRGKIKLLLNILWLEHVPARFKKMFDMLISAFKDIISEEHVKTMKEVFEFLTEKLSPEQMKDSSIAEAVKGGLDKIACDEIIGKIISFIPGSDREALDAIAYIINCTKVRFDDQILDLFMYEPEREKRGKFGYVMSRLTGKIAKEVVSRIDEAISGPAALVAIELYDILKVIDPWEAHIVAERLIRNKNAHIRLQILESLSPDSAEEKDIMMKTLGEENDPEIRKKLLEGLVKTKNAETIMRLFDNTRAGVFKKSFLRDLVALCGTYKAEASIARIKKLLERKPIINTKARRALRVQSVLSLARIGTAEAMDIIRASLDDRDKSVRAMCKMAIESEKRSSGKVI